MPPATPTQAHGPYSQRPEWADVAPVVLELGRVVAIQYTAEHADALAYFRAVLASGELSARVLALTTDMIRFNQADYTAWRVRWRCVQALGAGALPSELEFTREVMRENAKNYQLWNHRRLCALALGPGCADAEDALTREALAADAKNYHAWAHRQAVVKLSGRWEGELAYAADLIGSDVRNNSAWNQRMFVLQRMPRPGGGAEAEAEWLRSELEFVAAAVQRAPRNEAPWRYLTGLFATLPPWATQPRALSNWPEVATICTEALRDCPSCAPAYDVLAQYYEGLAALAGARMAAAAHGGGGGGGPGPQLGALLQAADTAQALLEEAAVADPMRAPYWAHRQQGVASVAAAASALLV